jgi:hypothetical protein
MSTKPIRQCQCDKCQQEGDHMERMLHHQINIVMSRLDEQQRRWYAAVEANRYSHKGVELVSKITGLDEKTIRRGQAELAEDLVNRPEDRVRLPGGGRPMVEKKIPRLNNN